MKESLSLPNFLIPFHSNNLIRIGSTSDGSYLVDKNSVLESDFLISIGVGTVFEFEKKFLKLKKVPILAFDGSAGIITQLKKIKWRLRQIFYLRQKEYFLDSFQYFFAPFRFYTFFKNFRNKKLNNNYRKFVKKNVGKDKNFISLKNILDKYIIPESYKKIFFQIDIEGGEYKILDELIEIQDFISGLVIEFHDVSNNLREIDSFISKFSLKLVHNHINNIGGLTANKLPNVIECTFSNYSELEKVEYLPHILDISNSKKYFEYTFVRNNF